MTKSRERALIQSLSAPQLELLRRIDRYVIDQRFIDSWSRSLTSVEDTLTRFLAERLIEEATLQEKLDTRYRVVDVRQLLRAQGATPKGKKAQLVNQLLDVMGPDSAGNLVAGIRVYHQTPFGREVARMYQEDQQRLRLQLESDVLSRLRAGDAEGAGALVANYQQCQPFPSGLGIDWSKGYPESELASVSYLLSLAYDDLVLDQNGRREIGLSLAYSMIIGERLEVSAKRILQVTQGSFNCPALVEFLRTRPCGGYAQSFDPAEPTDLAELYVHTKLGEAILIPRLRCYLAWGAGIGIVTTADDPCPVCSQEPLKFPRSQIQAIPKLPRHWGCRCTYSPMF